MADNTHGGPSKGTPHGGDQTAQVGQAAGGLPFGIQNPLSTGAPGSASVGTAAPDPTIALPVPTTVVGGAATADTSTGAPGSSGASAMVATGATYTIDTIGAWPRMDAKGGSVDTEAYGNKYGTNTLVGVQGNQPKGTGAPASGDGGSVSHGNERIH